MTDIVVVGLGFGDEAKGATVDYLASRYPGPTTTVIRFNGGAQAAHNVHADGAHHTFSQFGSGTLSGARTFLSSKVLVDPIALAEEVERLESIGVSKPLELMSIHPDALVTTLYHVAANRAREQARGVQRHGSCGRGIGETKWYDLAAQSYARRGQLLGNLIAPNDAHIPALSVQDCLHPNVLRSKLTALRYFYEPLATIAPSVDELAEVYTEFANSVLIENISVLENPEHLIYEGAQGVLLDQDRGFHPYTTWSDCRPNYAKATQAALGRPRPYVLGVHRTYHTRHGAGPFPSEDPHLRNPELHNTTGIYQGDWRQGPYDAVLARYAISCAGKVDGIALSHCDIPVTRYVSRYIHPNGKLLNELPIGKLGDIKHQEYLTKLLQTVTPEFEDLFAPVIPDELDGVPVALVSDGPDRLDRVAWPALP